MYTRTAGALADAGAGVLAGADAGALAGAGVLEAGGSARATAELNRSPAPNRPPT